MKLMPSLTWKVVTDDKKLFVTFDDGPHPTITPWVLQSLRQFNAKATFFCVGDNVRKFPETYDQILAEGHRTGNHTFNHLNGWCTNNSEYFDNIKQASTLIQSDLFRPPYGRITPAQFNHLKKDYRVIMWDILTRDFDKNLNTEMALQYCKEHINPGSVIVFHDSEKAEKNLKILLPAMLSHFHEKGFTFDIL
jgi:peptidoglycan/xylan/chitin deacetylase (PgdA/CDA1 family)